MTSKFCFQEYTDMSDIRLFSMQLFVIPCILVGKAFNSIWVVHTEKATKSMLGI